MKDGTSKNEIRFWGFDLCRQWCKENKMALIRLWMDCLRVNQKTLWTLRIHAWKFDLVSQCQTLWHSWHRCDKHPVVLSSSSQKAETWHPFCISMLLAVSPPHAGKCTSVRRDAQVHQQLAPSPALLLFFFFLAGTEGKKTGEQVHRHPSIYPPIRQSIQAPVAQRTAAPDMWRTLQRVDEGLGTELNHLLMTLISIWKVSVIADHFDSTNYSLPLKSSESNLTEFGASK